MMEKFKKFRKKLVLLSAALCVNFAAAPKSQAMGPSQVKKYNSDLEEDEKSNGGIVRRTVKSLIPIAATLGTAFCLGKYYGKSGGDTIMPEQFSNLIIISSVVGVITAIATEFGFDTVCNGFSKLGNYFSSNKKVKNSDDVDLHKKENKSADKKKDGNSGKVGDKSDAVSKVQLVGRKFIKALSDLLVFRPLDVNESIKSQIRDIENEAFYKADVLHSLTLNVTIDARSKKIRKVAREIIEKEMQDEFVKEFRFLFTQDHAEVVAEKLEEATKKIEKISF